MKETKIEEKVTEVQQPLLNIEQCNATSLIEEIKQQNDSKEKLY